MISERPWRSWLLGLLALVFSAPSGSALDYHGIGWSNALLPGSGQAWLGRPGQGAIQAGYEIGAFALGINLDQGPDFSLDGFISPEPTGRLRRRSDTISWDRQVAGDMLQELGIKAHMTNTFLAYREAAAARHDGGTLALGIDDTPTLDLFLEPFRRKNLTDPWVYVPIAVVAVFTALDYYSQIHGTAAPVPRLSPSSNFMVTLNYGIWQPIGSGAPEEMFYRGFLQNEFQDWVPSPFFAIPLSSLLFALSHAPGDGRYSAGVAGLYLGTLAYRERGRLAKGITVHFWSDMLLGIETIFLSQILQRTTPPASFGIQINY